MRIPAATPPPAAPGASAQTRAEVLLAAVRLFGRSGGAGTTVAAIAAEAGVAVETKSMAC